MTTRTTPAGITPGAFAVVGALGVGMAIVRLTGAAAVLLLLIATLVAVIMSVVASWRRLGAIDLVSVTAPSTATSGLPVVVRILTTDSSTSNTPVNVSVFGVRADIVLDRPTLVQVVAPAAGIVEEVTVTFETAGAGGLLTWRRRAVVPIENWSEQEVGIAVQSAWISTRLETGTMFVAPEAEGPALPITPAGTDRDGASSRGGGPRNGDLDGTRPWRPGEGEHAIHWASTMRSGELVAFERESSTDVRWTIDVDNDPGRLRYTLEDGLRQDHEVAVTDDATARDTALIDATADPVTTNDEAIVWSAIAASRRAAPDESAPMTQPWWQRPLSLASDNTEPLPVPVQARMLIGLAALAALWMLLGALDSDPSDRIGVTLGLIVATGASARFSGRGRPWWVRAAIIFVAASALGRIAVQASGITGFLDALRGPMPDFLMLLVVLHGAELADRRTARVHLALTGVVVAYATGLRVDGNVGWWMLAWGIAAIAATCRLEAVGARRVGAREAGRLSIWAATGIVATLGIASFVPVPDGPASLGLPSVSPTEAPTSDFGALIGPDGNPTTPTSTGDPSRGAIGTAAGYPGFSDALDTSVRGDLGDEVVMKVRAPEPAFWRGQTFTQFDGRIWRVDNAVDELIEGPNIAIPATLGSQPMGDAEVEEFVQTFHIEQDLPNVIFAATRAETVIFEGGVFARPDGAIRADRALTAGTVYSVVSQRVPVTPESLRAQGDLAERFAPFAEVPEVAPFLALPESTSQATIDLAASLRVDGSTYDTIRAYEAWMSANTEYDLDAPVPDGDAVDDFLFASQRGFCEQIASSLVIMLRSQGVPARLATGYIPGVRDDISGVFEVRASDAHAWVEVWFPDSGWEAFDPTASVPLAGDAERATVGGDATSSIIDGVVARPLYLVGVLALGAAAIMAIRMFGEWRRRRDRGQWGLLHDRFMSLAPTELTAPRVAASVERRVTTTALPHDVAVMLDRFAYDPEFVADAEMLGRLRDEVRHIERDLASVS